MEFIICNLDVALSEAIKKKEVYAVDIANETAYDVSGLTIADLTDVPETMFFVLVKK